MMEEYERNHDLPPLVGVSAKQVLYGRSCRYRYLSQAYNLHQTLSETDKPKLIAWLKKIKTNKNPRFWIERKGQSMADEWRKRVESLVAEGKKTAKKPGGKNKGKANVDTYVPTRSHWNPKRRPPSPSWKLSASRRIGAD